MPRAADATATSLERRVTPHGPPLTTARRGDAQIGVVGVGRRRVGSAWRKRITLALFLLPAIALYVLFVLVPIVQGAYYSGFDWNGLAPLSEFIGFDNYREALADPAFLASLRHVFLIVVLSLTVQLPFALGLALLLNQRIRGRAILRLLFFLPFVLSEVITAVVWRLLLQPDGLADQTFAWLGLGGLIQEWLADPKVVLYTLFVVITWKYFGFHMILYLAGLQQIPRELEEAAALDGATKWKAFRHVTLPLLGPTIRISAFLSIIGSLQLFDLVWVMTGGGPVNASNTMAVYMIDRGFERSRFGYGSAVAVLVFLVCFVFALGYQRFVLRRDVAGAMTTMGAV
jgi:raffinose/stachyose/melibiose transport system permease protein